MSSDAPRRSRWRILVGIGLTASFLIVGGLAVYALTRGGDVSNPNVEFRPEPIQTPAPEEGRPSDPPDEFLWSIYGYSKDRRRYLPAPARLRPPFHRVWSLTGSILLEFPPVLGGRWGYLLKNNAALYAFNKRTGKVRWKRKVGYLAAASPVYYKGRVCVVILKRGKTINAGRVSCFSVKKGIELWSRLLPSRAESSPLVHGGNLIFGSENGTVYSLRMSDGGVNWTFKARGEVKGGLAFADGKLYFGDYSGRVYAIRADTGRRVWDTGTKGTRFGLASGNFYSTPAVAFGRVYIGNTDGKIYSFASSSGKLAWTKSTGGYVYASPAAVQVPGGQPTIYAGSYSGRFYALDAKSGRVRWSFNAGGRISGGATVIGDIVYFSELRNKRTFGLGARTGRKVFEFGRGAFNPVVSDGETIFLTGYSSLYALRPLSARGRKRVESRARQRARARSAARREARARDARLQNGCRERAGRLHDRRAARIRSFRACVRRERAERTRAACRRAAARVHTRESRRLRSLRRCVSRNRR